MWEARHGADRKPESDKPERAQPSRVTGPPLLPRACSNTEVVLRSTAGKFNSWRCFGGKEILQPLSSTALSKLSIKLAWAH